MMEGMFETRKNYAAFYDERRNMIVATPRARSIPKYTVRLLLFCVAALFLPGFALYWVNRLVAHLAGWDANNLPGWYFFTGSLIALLTIVLLFSEVAPRFGFFPGAFGGKLVLSNTSVDRKLARLVKKHPFALNVDWFPQWAEAKTLYEQERILDDLKEALGYGSREERRRKKR